jgi:hypothetical protein
LGLKKVKMEDNLVQTKINEILSLLSELTVKGSENIYIMSNVFARLQFVSQELKKINESSKKGE